MTYITEMFDFSDFSDFYDMSDSSDVENLGIYLHPSAQPRRDFRVLY